MAYMSARPLSRWCCRWRSF